MCWKQPLRTAISPHIPVASMGACDSTPSSSSALLRGQDLPVDSSAVLGLEEEQARADQALNMPPERATGGSEKCQGHSPCPVIFQQTANASAGGSCREERCCCSVHVCCCCSLEGVFSCNQPLDSLSNSATFHSRAANCLEMLKNYRS